MIFIEIYRENFIGSITETILRKGLALPQKPPNQYGRSYRSKNRIKLYRYALLSYPMIYGREKTIYHWISY